MSSIEKKERAAYYTAIISFIVGWGLTIAGFCVSPVGEVDGSVLAILGEAMVYTAAVLGVTLYFRNQMEQFRTDTRRYLNGREAQEQTSRHSELEQEAEEAYYD